MFTVDNTLPVNADLGPNDPPITRAQIWQGLMMKVEDAVPFVPAMTVCTVTERFEGGLMRDIVFGGEPMTEKILFHPMERVDFIRTAGIEMGTIVNEILEDKNGELLLRFGFTLEREGMPHGSAAEKEFADTMAKGYLIAVQATIDEIRGRVRAGALDPA